MKTIRPYVSSDGSRHESYFAASWRSLRYSIFNAAYDGRPQVYGFRWDRDAGKSVPLAGEQP